MQCSFKYFEQCSFKNIQLVSKGGNDFNIYLPGTVLSKKRAIMTPGNMGFPTIISSTLLADSLPEEVGLDK